MIERRTIDGTANRAVIGGAKSRNNGRYNGNGREWETPPEIFGPLNAEFDLRLDVCATARNAKCLTHFDEAANGLLTQWAPLRCWMNPPYGREVYAWTRKAREEAQRGALVVGLLPASTDLAWWHEDVVGHAEVRYLRGRVRFLTDGPYRASGFFPSVVVVWRPPAGRRGGLEVMAKPVPTPRDKESSSSSSSAPPLAARLVEPPLDLEPIRRRIEAYFKAGWNYMAPGHQGWSDFVPVARDFYAEAVRDVPALLAEIDRLQAGRLVDPSPLTQLSENKEDDQARVDKGVNRHGQDLPQRPTGDKSTT